MWTWEKIKRCEEIERGVWVDSKSDTGYGFYNAVIVDKINDTLKIADGESRYTCTEHSDYSDFRFFHTTGEEILPPKERETITLYETMSGSGVVRMCDENGFLPSFNARKIVISNKVNTKIRKANINKKKSVVIYADTFEVKEWRN